MVKTPQRGRRYEGEVKMININIDARLKHALKLAALEARTSTRAYVTRIVEESLSGEVRAQRVGPGATRPMSQEGIAKLGFHIAPRLHLRIKRAAEDADITVTEYLTRLIEGAVCADGGGVSSSRARFASGGR